MSIEEDIKDLEERVLKLECEKSFRNLNDIEHNWLTTEEVLMAVCKKLNIDISHDIEITPTIKERIIK